MILRVAMQICTNWGRKEDKIKQKRILAETVT
jgi:hypothetical protein